LDHTIRRPFSDALNKTPKSVVSTTLTELVAWLDYTLLRGAVAEAIRELRASPATTSHIMGSGALIQSLMRHDLTAGSVYIFTDSGGT
jgi:hypothetical protein